jgi:MFS family permease
MATRADPSALPAAPPKRRLTVPDQIFLSLHWFGLNFHWGALLAVAIPAEVLKFVPEADKGRALATVFAGGAFIALVVLPLVGALSDRALFRMGRRRPFILAGALLNAVALVALGSAPTFTLFILAYWFVQFSNNLGGSAYGGLIPDLVPEEQRGFASGLMGLMTMLGTILAAVIAGRLMERGLRLPLYLTIAAVLLITMAVTVWKVRETPLRSRPLFQWRTFLAQFWVSPRAQPDFAWLFISRFLAMMGFYTILTFLQFFLKDFLRVPRYTEATGTLTATVVIGALVSAFFAGWLSDRVGRRGIVSAATLLMGVLCLVFLTGPTFELMLGLGVLFGLGYGAFVSVEWALATDVLPSAASAAKDLGIWGISVTLPQVFAPLVGGPVLDGVNRLGPNWGYFALMLMAAAYFGAGAITVWRIRGAR